MKDLEKDLYMHTHAHNSTHSRFPDPDLKKQIIIEIKHSILNSDFQAILSPSTS